MIEFSEVEETLSSKDYAYKIGTVDFGKLSHALYRENPELFIAFFPESEHQFKLANTVSGEKLLAKLVG